MKAKPNKSGINTIVIFIMAGIVLFSNSTKLHAMPLVPADSSSLKPVVLGRSKVQFSGYLQAQYQVAAEKGIPSFSGGNFPKDVSNRFMLRRSRLKAVFKSGDDTQLFQTSFTFLIEATERGVAPRDLFGTLSENHFGLFTLSTGLFVRPFGYELTYSSQKRESPERGRMSQLLMKTERDVGVMLTLHPRQLKGWQLDLGVFNGPGLSATSDYDSYKDVIGRLQYKTSAQQEGIEFSGGISGYYGGIKSDTMIIFRQKEKTALFMADTSASNKGSKLPRHYAGADVQCSIPGIAGATTLRAEWISGRQTGTRFSSETPASLQHLPAVRHFNGGYFYLLQALGNDNRQLVLKYDFYDPNTAAKGSGIDPAAGFNAADIAYHTFGGGFVWQLMPSLKLTMYYDHVVNEKTSLPGYEQDIRDDVFTLRLQYQF